MHRRTSPNRTAFTLIELLVVIAIIAILAAILFPVFAQAKKAAKKAVTISQAKQTGTAIIMYTSDSDDLGPSGVVPDLTSTTVLKFLPGDAAAQSPAGWFNYPVAQDEYALIWHNTTEPYRKSYDLMNPPGNTLVNITSAPWPAGYAAPLQAPKGVNFTYNGLMQGWSFSAVARPSMTPIVWQGAGDLTRNGAAMANPRLNCNATGPCVFNPGGPPQTASTGQGSFFNIFLGTAHYTTFGVGNVYVFSDTSAKLIIFGHGNQAPYYPTFESTKSLDPLQFINDDGTVTQNFIRGCHVPGTGTLYVAAFMPNNTFDGSGGICQ